MDALLRWLLRWLVWYILLRPLLNKLRYVWNYIKQKKGSFTDPRDGKTYKTIKIGKQIWMAENLNYECDGSKCYNNDSANCQKYGRLYDWNTAMKSSPPGWHLPSDNEWCELVDFAGGVEVAGKRLKTSSWDGTDEYGFSALPSGYGSSDGNFRDVGNHGTWWSSSTDDDSYAYHWYMDYDHEGVGRLNYDKAYLFSVRCIRDREKREKTNGKGDKQ